MGNSKKIALFFALAVSLVGLPTLIIRLISRKTLESPELKQTAERYANIALGGLGLRVELPQVNTTGFMDVDLEPIKLFSLKQVPLGSLGLRVQVDGFPGALLGRNLSLVGRLSENLRDTAKNTIEFSATPSLWDLFDLKKNLTGSAVISDGAARGSLDALTTLLGEIQIDLKNIEYRFIKALWPSPESFLNARLTQGELSGQIRVLKGGGDSLKIKLNLSSARWISPLFEKASIKTEATTLEGSLQGRELRLSNPLQLKIEIEGGTQALVIKKSWGMSLSDRIYLGAKGAEYNLQVRVTGGPLAILAAGRLLRCRLPPMRESFRVEGPAAQPHCS